MGIVQKLKGCEGCARRKEWLAKTATKIRTITKQRDPQSNAARTIVRKKGE